MELKQGEPIQRVDDSVNYSPAKKSRFPFIILITLIVVVIILGTSFYLGLNKVKQDSEPAASTQSQPAVFISPTPTIDPTADWKTYINNNGFSVKLPNDYVTPSSEKKFGLLGEQVYFSVSENNPLNCMGDCPVIESSKQIIVNNLSTTTIEGFTGEIGGCVSRRYISYVFNNNNSFTTLTLNATNCNNYGVPPEGTVYIKEKDKELFYQILSTFTFLDQKSDAGWKTETIDLYSLSLQIPTNWTLQEINRRSEPTGPEAPTKGHDCADYTIKSDNNYAILSLKPTCGFADGGASLWPNDAVIVKQYQSSYPKYIIRFFDHKNDSYKYSGAGEATISDLEGTRTEKTYSDPPIISFGFQGNLIFVGVEFQYLGPEASIDQYLETADKVVASLEKL